VNLLQTPQYVSSAELFVSTTDAGSTTDVFQGGQFSQQRVASYARLLTGDDLAERVIDRLDLRTTPAGLSSRVTATPVTDTVLIDVTVRDSSPQRAEQVTDTLVREFIEFVGEVEAPGPGGVSPVRVTLTERPELPQEPASPQTGRNCVLGALIGFLLGGALAVLRARMDRSVKDADEAAELGAAPVIGTVLRDQALEKRHTIDRIGQSRTAEDYRQLRNNLQFVRVDDPPRVIMISSALPSEGKTTLVINLALALADAGQRVIIIEADLRRPKVASYLGLIGGTGLTNVLAGTAELDDVLQRYGADGITVMAGGPMPPNPGELLASSHMQALVAKLRGQYDFVLIDVPPLLPVADASGLAAQTDGVLLSVRYGSTRKDQLRQAAATVERVGGITLGLVLNIVPPRADIAMAYGYGYGYDAGKHAAI
jgi:receptor protein-tyrosine kinase